MSHLLPAIIASDLEGVFLPEIWIAVAERTGLPELRLTTRDVPDYDELMRYRLQILAREQLTLAAIQAVIATMEPLPGAVAFLDWARAHTQLVIITDSFYEFVTPFLPKLHYPTLFAHQLQVDEPGHAHRLSPAHRGRQTQSGRILSRPGLPHPGRRATRTTTPAC